MGFGQFSLLAPLFLAFEIWQLAIAERYLGIKQIARGGDPREMGPGEGVSFFWVACILAYAAWAVGLLLVYDPRIRGTCLVHGLGLIVVTGVGASIRRDCGLKWILVVLTFEGALRVGLLVSLFVMAWRRIT
jgi:hypothetical protein